MSDEPELSPEDAHPRAAELLTDAFFWDAADEAAPFGNDTGRDTLAKLKEFRDGHPKESTLTLLAELLVAWEVSDKYWDAISAAAVEEAGRDDEFSTLMRDEIILALAFGELIEDGRIEPEIQRRAVLATFRQELPLVLAAWGGQALKRATYLEKMRHALNAASRGSS